MSTRTWTHVGRNSGGRTKVSICGDSTTSLPGVLVVEPKVHRDARGYLFESYRFDV